MYCNVSVIKDLEEGHSEKAKEKLLLFLSSDFDSTNSKSSWIGQWNEWRKVDPDSLGRKAYPEVERIISRHASDNSSLELISTEIRGSLGSPDLEVIHEIDGK